MITLFALLIIAYIGASTYIGMEFAEFCRRRFGWDEVGVTFLMVGALWFIPITVAMDMGWIQ